MNYSKAKREIERLKKELNKHNYYYYVLNKPTITDYEYDQLYKKLVELERKFPRLVTRDSPTQRIGDQPLKEFKTVEHKIKMLSLDNTYSEKELYEFDKRVKKGLNKKIKYEVTLKVDGVAVTLHYEGGKFVLGATRGDGRHGDDITQNLRTIRSIPLDMLTDAKELKEIEVRGEVFLSKKSFERLNKERKKAAISIFANPRNAAAGTLKLLDSKEVARRGLDIFIHTVPKQPGPRFQSHYRVLQELAESGFKIVPHIRLCRDVEAILEYIKEWQERRKTLDYEVDGLVVKIDDFASREILGDTIKNPRWAIAYKYPALQVITQLEDIRMQVGRTGRVTPVAVLNPVSLSGTTVSRATLHNEDEIKRKDIRIGDYVIVEKGGEVIPKIVGVAKERRRGRERPFRFPKTCPVCGEKIYRLPDEADWRCVNSSCPAQIKGAILHFASRQAMDIEGLGYTLVEKLVDMGLLKSFDDIYRLKKEKIARLERMGGKSAQNLIEAIEKSKEKEFLRVIYALGIPNVGMNAANLLANEFRSVDALIDAKVEELSKIAGIGEFIAHSVINYFKNKKNLKVIANLKEIGLNFRRKKTIGETFLTGKTFVFTGELSAMKREQAQAVVREHGGHPASAVSRRTDFVVAGKSPGSKYTRAKKLGVKIISEQEFLRILKRG